MDVNSRIKQLRKDCGITMQQLSSITNISQPVLSKLENGNRIVDIPSLEKICEALNITLAEFFNENTKPITLTPKLKELVDSSKNLTQEQFELILNLIKQFKN